MKITITIETDKPSGGNYITEDEARYWVREQRRIREEQERDRPEPQDWLDSYRTFFRS